MNNLKEFFEEYYKNEEDNDADNESYLDIKAEKSLKSDEILDSKLFFQDSDNEKKDTKKTKFDDINITELQETFIEEPEKKQNKVQKTSQIFSNTVQIKKQPLDTNLPINNHFLDANFSNTNLEKEGLRQIKQLKGQLKVTFNKTDAQVTQEVNDYLKENNLNINQLISIIESVLFVKGVDGLNVVEIQKVCNLPIGILNSIIDQMIIQKDNDNQSGLCIRKFGHRIKMLSKQETYDSVSKILSKDTSKLIKKQKLIVLAIIAYNQPCTKNFINKFRRKDSTNILKTLAEEGLISKGKKDGNKYVYSVTQTFFDKCGIKNLNDLPKLSKTFNFDLLSTTDDSSDFEE